jgi:hypothetical protein
VQTALLLLQSVLREAERRGYSIVEVSGSARTTGIAIEIRGHIYAIRITELADRVPMTRDEPCAAVFPGSRPAIGHRSKPGAIGAVEWGRRTDPVANPK